MPEPFIPPVRVVTALHRDESTNTLAGICGQWVSDGTHQSVAVAEAVTHIKEQQFNYRVQTHDKPQNLTSETLQENDFNTLRNSLRLPLCDQH